MWIDTRDTMPLADGEYMVQTVYGDVRSMMYTFKGGWNTYYDRFGELHGDGEKFELYVVRWYKLDEPGKVPNKWLKEFFRKGVRV